jgi:hypothetical protein
VGVALCCVVHGPRDCLQVEVYSRKIAEEMEKLNQMETDENRE